MRPHNDARLFVGNLPEVITKDALRRIFEQCGEVRDVYIPYQRTKDGRLTYKSKGFAFIEMDCAEDARVGIEIWNEKVVFDDGQRIVVRVANERA